MFFYLKTTRIVPYHVLVTQALVVAVTFKIHLLDAFQFVYVPVIEGPVVVGYVFAVLPSGFSRVRLFLVLCISILLRNAIFGKI